MRSQHLSHVRTYSSTYSSCNRAQRRLALDGEARIGKARARFIGSDSFRVLAGTREAAVYYFCGNPAAMWTASF